MAWSAILPEGTTYAECGGTFHDQRPLPVQWNGQLSADQDRKPATAKTAQKTRKTGMANASMAASSAGDDRLKLLANCVSATLTVLSFGVIHGNQRPTRPQGRGFEPASSSSWREVFKEVSESCGQFH